VDAEPVIILPCSHVFTVSTLDGLVGLSCFYMTGDDGHFVGLSPLAAEFSKVPTCPDCRSPLLSIKRYGRAVKKSLVELSEKRLVYGKGERVVGGAKQDKYCYYCCYYYCH